MNRWTTQSSARGTGVACACSRPVVDDRLRDVARWVHMTSPAKATRPERSNARCLRSIVSLATTADWWTVRAVLASGRLLSTLPATGHTDGRQAAWHQA